MEYMSCPEAAKKWGVSDRRVQKTMRRKSHPRRFPHWEYVADPKKHRETIRSAYKGCKKENKTRIVYISAF